MKKASLLALLLLALAAGLSAQVYDHPRRLYTLKTEHFTIIFPEESRSAAERLQGMAEGIYDEVAGKLRAAKTLHIPVVITPDSEELNGYFSLLPTRIVLYQAPLSPNSGFALYDDELRKLFMHELTHAVSLTIRAPFWGFLAAVFSDALAPSYLMAPDSLIEGATVSFESANGFGRAADTPYAAVIRQDILEGKFKSFEQAAGAWTGDRRGIYYIYGGYFSRYLQKAYGMDRYAALWHEMGNGNMIAGFEGLGPLKGAFEKTYGMKLDDAWEGFRRSMALSLPAVTPTDRISDRPDYLQRTPLAAGGGKLFWADSRKVWRFDPATGKSEALMESDFTITGLSPSPDGSELLVSRYRYEGKYPKAVLELYDIRTGRRLASDFPSGLAEASWLPDGRIVASRLTGYGQDLVLLDGPSVSVLFHGTERYYPAAACAYGEGGIAFILQIDGTNHVARMDLATKAVGLLSSDEPLLRLRGLSSDGERLFFSYDPEDSLLRLASYGPEGLEVERTLLSGGVQFPVGCGAEVYYEGYFSDGDLVMRYGSGNPALKLQAVPSAWEPFSPAGSLVSAYDEPPRGKAGVYSPLSWMIKPVFFYPTFSSNSALPFPLNGAGASWQRMDPTETWTTALSASYLWDSHFVSGEAGIACAALPARIALLGGDSLSTLSTSAPYGTELARTSWVSLGLSQNLTLEPTSRALSWSLSGRASAVATGPGASGEALGNPYAWAYAGLTVPVSASLSYSDLKRDAFQDGQTRGFSLGLSYDGCFSGWTLSAPAGVADLSLGLRLPWMGFSSSIDAAVAARGDVILGTQGPLMADGSAYLGGYAYPSYGEFSALNADAAWLYLYQETGLSRSFPVDASLPLWLYLRSISLEGGYRSAVAGWNYLQSAYARVGLSFCLARGVGSVLPQSAIVEYALPIHSDQPGRFSFGLNIAY